jgi:DNA-binding CsgD family transcriptional regulator
MLVVTPVDRARVASATVLQGLFDLTPAEARVAKDIGEGRSIAEIAAKNGLAVETVRSYLKAVLAKTGLHRQPELVSLLAGSTLSAAEPPPA